MKTIQYLEAEDTIQPGDFLRPLDLIYEGQSDYKVGKHKGQTGAQVNRADPSYFEKAF